MARDRHQAQRHYPRTARVNELCREILGDELERVDDDRLVLVTITHVSVDPDLRHAVVEFSALGEGEDEAKEALDQHRLKLTSAYVRRPHPSPLPPPREREPIFTSPGLPGEVARSAGEGSCAH